MEDAELCEEIRSYIADAIAEGFDTDDEIVESAVEYYEDETGRDDLRPVIVPIVAELSARHHAEQALWESPTDCDRLDRAFDDLERRGIVARQDFSCCQNCGHAEIGAEVKATRATRDVVGYTFYHMQDTESAVHGGGLFLAYGALKDGREPLIHVGREIVDALRRAGLKAEWNESPEMRIRVIDLDWRRRRP